MATKQSKVALALAPSAPVATVKAESSPDPRIAEFREFGRVDAQSENAWISRIPQYAHALKDCDFQTWERMRVAYVEGATEGGYARPDDLWSRRVVAALKAMGIEKPKSATSSAARPKSAEAQARADKAKAEHERLSKLSDTAIKAELADKRTSAETRAALYVELAKRVKSAKREQAAKDREAGSNARKACSEQLDLMSAIGLQHALAVLVEIAKKYPKA